MNAYVIRHTGEGAPSGFVLRDVEKVEFLGSTALLYRRPDADHPRFLQLLAMVPLQGVTIAFGTEAPAGFSVRSPDASSAEQESTSPT